MIKFCQMKELIPISEFTFSGSSFSSITHKCTLFIYNQIDCFAFFFETYIKAAIGPPGVLGIWGEWLFIFRELGSTGNYLRGAREQAHNFGDIGSLAKKQKKKKKKK